MLLDAFMYHPYDLSVQDLFSSSGFGSVDTTNYQLHEFFVVNLLAF